MLKDMHLRSDVLIVHGVLALLLGGVFLYVGASISNLFFEALAVILALILSAAALLLAAVTDWIAAVGEGPRHRETFLFYAGSGAVLAIAAVAVGCMPEASTEWLVLLGAGHALVFGTVALFWGSRIYRHRSEQGLLLAAGAISVLFSGVIAGLAATRASIAEQIGILGLYLLFAGIKMLCLSWGLHRSALMAGAHTARRATSRPVAGTAQ